jgi:ACR3 family arsenite transporter
MASRAPVASLPGPAPLTGFERHLTLWVCACIMAGVVFGKSLPDFFGRLAALEVAHVNIPVGVLMWVMIVPMLMRVDFGALRQVRRHGRGIGVTLFVNWLVKPFSMALIGTFFLRHVFSRWLPGDQVDGYIAGLILLAAAPCTAMVFAWSRLSNGDPGFTLVQVALNDTIMVFTFAPLVGLLLGASSIAVPWDTLLASVLFYIAVPVLLAQVLRRRLAARGKLQGALKALSPWSTLALLAMLTLLFAFQGDEILANPLLIAMLAVPILLQVLLNASIAYLLNRAVGECHAVACPSALIGASNFFELAVAAAVSLFGVDSAAVLATVVGVLVEVPVMLLVVRFVNGTRDWYNAGRAPTA